MSGAPSNGWDSYVWQIQNSYSAKKGSYMKMNVCQHAAIIGNDGSPWATTSEWPGLSEYEHEQDTEDGGTTNVKVNEHKAAMQAAVGNRTPTIAGIRMGGMKYVLTNYDASCNMSMLTKQGGGGAAVMKTKNAIVIGMWNKDAVMTNNMNQNSGDCSLQVEKVANLLKEAGY